MSIPNHRKPETIAAQANGASDPESGGIVPALQPSTTYLRDQNNELFNQDFIYGRDENTSVKQAESILNALENASETLLFASGMAAISAVISQLRSGQKLLLQSNIYYGTTKWISEFCARTNIKLIEMDCADTEATIDRIVEDKPALVFIETPSNPWLKIVDIHAISKACKAAGETFLVVDSTAATPCLTQPLALGAHMVVHSATKAINGHSDLLAGFVSCADANSAIWNDIAIERHDRGAIIGSFEAWLLIRGMRTLPLRIERMCENAKLIAEFLSTHEKVERVLYPGLSNHPGHELASKQMSGGFGYLMSVLIRGDKTQTLKVCGGLNIIHRATSLGGVESLIEHRQSIEGEESEVPANLLRISVGIEHVDDLIGDLDQALNSI